MHAATPRGSRDELTPECRSETGEHPTRGAYVPNTADILARLTLVTEVRFGWEPSLMARERHYTHRSVVCHTDSVVLNKYEYTPRVTHSLSCSTHPQKGRGRSRRNHSRWPRHRDAKVLTFQAPHPIRIPTPVTFCDEPTTFCDQPTTFCDQPTPFKRREWQRQTSRRAATPLLVLVVVAALDLSWSGHNATPLRHPGPEHAPCPEGAPPARGAPRHRRGVGPGPRESF